MRESKKYKVHRRWHSVDMGEGQRMDRKGRWIVVWTIRKVVFFEILDTSVFELKKLTTMLPPLQPQMALRTVLTNIGATVAPIYLLGRHTTVVP